MDANHKLALTALINEAANLCVMRTGRMFGEGVWSRLCPAHSLELFPHAFTVASRHSHAGKYKAEAYKQVGSQQAACASFRCFTFTLFTVYSPHATLLHS